MDMKIDSMDASSIQIVKPAEVSTKLSTTSAVAPVSNVQKLETSPITNDKSDSYESQMISQMTPFQKSELPISEKVIVDAIEKANKAISGGNRRFEFSIHSKTKEIVVKVIDSDTNELIREIPNEKILDMVAKMWDMAGINVDERR
jgi:flagellar protein FlaG